MWPTSTYLRRLPMKSCASFPGSDAVCVAAQETSHWMHTCRTEHSCFRRRKSAPATQTRRDAPLTWRIGVSGEASVQCKSRGVQGRVTPKTTSLFLPSRFKTMRSHGCQLLGSTMGEEPAPPSGASLRRKRDCQKLRGCRARKLFIVLLRASLESVE